MKYRLQWGKPDTLSLLRSSLDEPVANGQDSHMPELFNGHIQTLPNNVVSASLQATINNSIPPALTEDGPAYFNANTPPELFSIIQNDWPYSG